MGQFTNTNMKKLLLILFLLMSIYSESFAAIARVQQKISGNLDTTSPTVTLDAAATVGNLIVTVIGVDKSATTITVPTGYTSIGAVYVGASVSGWMAYKISVGGETAIQWTVGGYNNGCTAWAGEYSGTSATPLDAYAVNNSGDVAVGSISTGTTGSTVQTNEVAIAWMAIDSAAYLGEGTTWSNSFTEIARYSPNDVEAGVRVAEKTLSSTGTQETTASGFENNDQTCAGIVTFKAAGSTAGSYIGTGTWGTGKFQ
jgi:hypothetical protein